MFEGLLAPKPLLPEALVPVLPVEEVPVDVPPLADAPLAPAPPAPAPPPPAPPPPLDCALAIATANITLANNPIPYMAVFIFNSSASRAKTKITARRCSYCTPMGDSPAPERALSPCLCCESEQS
jgi:hypothetical protein